MIIGALLLLAGLVMGGVGLLILLLFGGFFGYLFILVMLGMLGAGIYFFVRGLTYKVESPPALMVTDVLARELGGQYTFIRNISRAGLGYIDGVLVGPPGTLVFRIVDKPGIYLNEGADWLERVGGKPFMLSRMNPTRECVTDVYALRKYLAQKQLGNVPVYGIVVFIDPNVQLTARQPIVPIAELRTLMQAIRADFMRQETRIDAQTVQRVVDTIYQG
jgi:hypothetical protein